MAAPWRPGRRRTGGADDPGGALRRPDRCSRSVRPLPEEFLMRERPLSAVPRAVLATLIVAVAAQVAVRSTAPAAALRAEDLPAPPSAPVLRLASFAEPIALAKIMMLYLQSADYRAGDPVPYRHLD